MADAYRADLRDVQVSVVAEVARNYLELRGAQARRIVADENARIQRDTLRLTSVRRDVVTAIRWTWRAPAPG